MQQTLALMKIMHLDTLASKLAKIAISWAQILAGTSTPIFKSNAVKLPQLRLLRWIPNLRMFLARHNFELEYKVNFIPPIQRENDKFLMDLAKGKPKTIEMINACRLYLGVTLLSDIVTASGNKLRYSAIQALNLQKVTTEA